jgi:hypothetical protein
MRQIVSTRLQQAAHVQDRQTLEQEGCRHKQVWQRVYIWTYLKTAPKAAAPLEQLYNTWRLALIYSAGHRSISQDRSCKTTVQELEITDSCARLTCKDMKKQQVDSGS